MLFYQMKNSYLYSISKGLDRFILKTGNFFSWCSVLLVLAIILQVSLRYGFNKSLIFLEEVQWHLFSILFLVGLSYAQVTDSHVRVDVFSQHFGPKKKALIEIMGLIFFLIPFLFIIFSHGLEFVSDSFIRDETSLSPGGLPSRWIIKSFILIGVFLLFISSFSRILKMILILRKPHGNN
jgi:TRAP-type mannitol/chloroaromatic compound transport system permease small subunit